MHSKLIFRVILFSLRFTWCYVFDISNNCELLLKNVYNNMTRDNCDAKDGAIKYDIVDANMGNIYIKVNSDYHLAPNTEYTLKVYVLENEHICNLTSMTRPKYYLHTEKRYIRCNYGKQCNYESGEHILQCLNVSQFRFCYLFLNFALLFSRKCI